MRVLLVDDSTILGDRVASMISEIAPDIKIVGQANSSYEVAESVRALRPDVVVLELHIAGGNGLEVLQNIKRNSPAPVVIIFTNYPFPQYRERCLEGGAEFFFDQSTEFGKLSETLGHLNRDVRSRASISTAGIREMKGEAGRTTERRPSNRRQSKV